MLEAGGDLDFLEEPLGADHRRELGVEHLDGDLPVVARIRREEDGRHSAAAELALDRIAVGQRPFQCFVHGVVTEGKGIAPARGAEQARSAPHDAAHRPRSQEGKGSSQIAARAWHMHVERCQPFFTSPTSRMSPDSSAPTQHQEVLKRSNEEVGQAREAAHEMRKPGVMATIRGFLGLLWATVFAFFSDGCSTMAAALSFNTFFSLPALLTLLLALVGRIADPAQVEHAIVGQVGRLIGPASAAPVAGIISSANRSTHAASVATIVSAVALIIGATGAFAQLQQALNKAWGVKPDPHRTQIRVFLLKRVFSFGILITVAFLLLVSLTLSTVISAISAALTSHYGVPPVLLQWTTALGSFLVIALLFAAMFRYVPDARISWRDVRAGALGTALLFVL